MAAHNLSQCEIGQFILYFLGKFITVKPNSEIKIGIKMVLVHLSSGESNSHKAWKEKSFFLTTSHSISDHLFWPEYRGPILSHAQSSLADLLFGWFSSQLRKEGGKPLEASLQSPSFATSLNPIQKFIDLFMYFFICVFHSIRSKSSPTSSSILSSLSLWPKLCSPLPSRFPPTFHLLKNISIFKEKTFPPLLSQWSLASNQDIRGFSTKLRLEQFMKIWLKWCRYNIQIYIVYEAKHWEEKTCTVQLTIVLLHLPQFLP